jgi:hypothetical protein
MITRPTTQLRTLCLILALPAGVQAARVTSDLLPPQRRQAAVETAERLAQRTAPPPLAENLPSPFNPPDFDRAEASEPQEDPGSRTANTGPVAPPPRILGDREILETLAAQLNPTGTIQMGDSSRLVMGSRRFEIGTRFTVSYNNKDYELELIAIERTTFTLRYRGEEITRPIKSVR